MAQVIFIGGARAGTIVSLSGNDTIGSSEGNDIVVSEAKVLPEHATVVHDAGFYRILPLDNAPIVVNGEETGPIDLVHGDLIRLGEAILLFSDEAQVVAGRKVLHKYEGDQPTSVVESHVRTFQDPQVALSHIKESDRLAEHMETLYRFGAAINATLVMDDLMAVMIDEVFGLYHPDRVLVYLLDPEGNPRLRSQRFSEDSPLRGLERVSLRTLNQAIKEQQALLTKKAGDEAAEEDPALGLHSAMAVPLVKTDNILGVLYMDSLDPAATYTPEDLQLMNAMAAQAALAVENVIRYEGRLDHSRKLAALGEISRKVSSHLSRNVVIREAVEGALHLFDCTKCSLLLYEEDLDALVVVHSNHIDRKAWNSIRIRPGEGLCGKVFRDGNPLLVEDVSQEVLAGRRVYDTKSFLIVPILARMEGIQAQSEPIGVIAVTDKRNGTRFDRDDQEFLSVLAGHVGIAINNARLYERATIDVLTSVFTRAFFFAQLEEEILAHRIRRAPLTVLMLDLDHFKRKNAELGHQGGDRILHELGLMLRQKFLRLGFVARYGGEEFVVLLRSTDIERARKVAESVRGDVEQFPFVDKSNPVHCTISIGVSQLEKDDDVDDLVRRADAALYHAKNEGRNRVETFDETTPMPTEFRRTRRMAPSKKPDASPGEGGGG